MQKILKPNNYISQKIKYIFDAHIHCLKKLMLFKFYKSGNTNKNFFNFLRLQNFILKLSLDFVRHSNHGICWISQIMNNHAAEINRLAQESAQLKQENANLRSQLAILQMKANAQAETINIQL